MSEQEPDPELIIRQYEVLLAQLKTIQLYLNENRPLQALNIAGDAVDEHEDTIGSFKEDLNQESE